MGRVVVVALDTFGDLVLRQPLFSRLLDEGRAVTVVVRRGYDEILPFLDARLEALAVDVNPYGEPDAEHWGRLEELGAALDRLMPEMLVAALYNRSYVDEWLLGRRTDLERVGFTNESLPASVLNALLPPDDPHRIDDRRIFSRVVRCPGDMHDAEKNRRLLGELIGRDPGDTAPVLTITPQLREQAAAVARGLGLEPGAYVFGSPSGIASTQLKAWPPDDYAKLAAHLGRAHRLPVLITGVQAAAPLLDEIVSCGSARGVTIARWIGRRGELGLLLGLIEGSRFYLGNDSGPMHFAGALGRPVVALFGGGTWPRFLPLAARSFVATQELPCFGCNWICWLESPLCVTRVDVATLEAGIDWVLGPEPDARRIDRGAPFDELAAEVVRSGVAATRAAVADLRGRLKESETDRAERLRIIEHLGEALKASEADRAARLDVIDDLNTRLGESQSELAVVETQFAAAERDSLARLEAIRNLERRIVEISSTKATVKRLIGIAARKTGVYAVLKRREPLARRVYGRLRGTPGGAVPRGRPARERPPDLRPSIHSSVVDAFVAARSMPGSLSVSSTATTTRPLRRRDFGPTMMRPVVRSRSHTSGLVRTASKLVRPTQAGGWMLLAL